MGHQFLSELLKRTGAFEGRGTNHDGAGFVGRMEVAPLSGGSGVSIRFSASGLDGAPFHEEQTWVSPGADEKPALWSVNSNNPIVLRHELREDGELGSGGRRLVFGYGRSEDRSEFREEITLELLAGGEIGYRYAWGLPNGEFAPRSGVTMMPVPAAGLDVWHVALAVTDLARSVAFYRDVVGFKVQGYDESPSKRQAFLVIREGGFALELFQARGEGAGMSSRSPDHLAFECTDLGAWRERVARSVDCEVPELESPDSGVKGFYVSDPDGLRIEFLQGRELYERTLRPVPIAPAEA